MRHWYERHPETNKWWLRIQKSGGPEKWAFLVEDGALATRLSETVRVLEKRNSFSPAEQEAQEFVRRILVDYYRQDPCEEEIVAIADKILAALPKGEG